MLHGQCLYHLPIHFVIVIRVPQLKTMNTAIDVRAKIFDVRVPGMRNEPEGDVVRKIQLDQVEKSLVDSQEHPVYLFAWDNQYFVIKVPVDYLSDLASVDVGIMLGDCYSIQPLCLDRRHNFFNDVWSRIGPACCLTTMGMEIKFQSYRILSGCETSHLSAVQIRGKNRRAKIIDINRARQASYQTSILTPGYFFPRD